MDNKVEVVCQMMMMMMMMMKVFFVIVVCVDRGREREEERREFGDYGAKSVCTFSFWRAEKSLVEVAGILLFPLFFSAHQKIIMRRREGD